MALTVHFIHAFTSHVFQGNAAAVIITDEALADELMQKIATENNVSETAFIVKEVKGADDVFNIRWFSPLSEIDFCGHATLASAYVLFNQNTLNAREKATDKNRKSDLTFYAKAVGHITVKQCDNGMIEMSFPNYKPVEVSDIPQGLMDGLSIKPCNILQNKQAYFAIYPQASDVYNVISDSALLKTLAPFDVVVTAPSDKNGYDFVSRYFWPANGGDEDPVTGSAHAGLTPYWAEKLNKKELIAFQASKRGGHLVCQLNDEKVLISGNAVSYLVGKIFIE